MRALDDVVLGLRALGVAGQPALLAEPAEVLPPGQQLVHVGLVAGVEDDRVARRVEDPVDRDRQLDDAEVRAEVTAGLRDFGDQEVRISAGELIELRRTRRVASRSRGSVNVLEQAHKSESRRVKIEGGSECSSEPPRRFCLDEAPQDVLQDAAVAVVVRLARGVDPHDRVELDRLLARRRVLARFGGDVDRLRRAALVELRSRPAIEIFSVPSRPSDSQLSPAGNCSGTTPMPIRFERWMRSKLSVMTALDAEQAGALRRPVTRRARSRTPCRRG